MQCRACGSQSVDSTRVFFKAALRIQQLVALGMPQWSDTLRPPQRAHLPACHDAERQIVHGLDSWQGSSDGASWRKAQD